MVGVNPGLTETQRFTQGLESSAKLAGVCLEEVRRRSIAAIPMGRLARPEEIAAVVVFLASDRASYVNAVIIGMDGASHPTVM